MPKLPSKFPIATCLALAFPLLLSASGVALSQGPGSAPALAPLPVISDDSVDDFVDLNRNLNSLREKIAKVREIVAKNEDANAPANQRAAFQKIVAKLLVAFGDDGEVAKFGQTALAFVDKGLADAQQDMEFPPEQREALVNRWRRVKTQTDVAAANLETTRRQLTDRLKVLQARADFLDQMEKLKQARAVLDAVADLGDERSAVAQQLRDLLQGHSNGDSGM
jgi:hypothetical protein